MPVWGGLEPSGTIVDGAGKRAADVPEQLALQQVLVQCPAVDSDEWAAAARTDPMDGLGDQFLAGPGFAQQQHRGIGLGHLPHQAIGVLHGRPRADQPRDRRTGFQRQQESREP